MTNNRTAGWDLEGNDLPTATIESVFPSHF